jgi:hypothetical protein
MDHVESLPELGCFTMDVQAQKGRKARIQAEFAVRGGPILLLPPHARYGHHENKPLPLHVVYVVEVSPPPDNEEPIHWMLLTNEPVLNFDDAWRVVDWYERRWVVEVFQADYDEKDNLYRGGRWAYSSRACVAEAGPLVPAAQTLRSRRRFMRSAKEGVVPPRAQSAAISVCC